MFRGDSKLNIGAKNIKQGFSIDGIFEGNNLLMSSFRFWAKTPNAWIFCSFLPLSENYTVRFKQTLKKYKVLTGKRVSTSNRILHYPFLINWWLHSSDIKTLSVFILIMLTVRTRIPGYADHYNDHFIHVSIYYIKRLSLTWKNRHWSPLTFHGDCQRM